MSVHPNKARGKYEVRYRDESGRNRSKSFERKADADVFDREVKRAKERARARAALRELEGAKR